MSAAVQVTDVTLSDTAYAMLLLDDQLQKANHEVRRWQFRVHDANHSLRMAQQNYNYLLDSLQALKDSIK